MPSPQQEERQRQVTDAASWKGKRGVELELPSGNICLARRPGITSFIQRGLIPNSLLGFVQQAQKGKVIDPSELLENTEKLQELMGMYDRILVSVVIEPRVLPVPLHEAERIPESLYADEVDDEDKQFIANWSMGGVNDLESFRRQQADSMESGAALASVGVPAQPTTGN